MRHPANNATTWLNYIWQSDLSPTQKLICCCLRKYMNAEREMAWPSKETIARECGLTSRCVRKNLPIICEAGYLIANGESKYGTTRYEILTPELDSPPERGSPLTLNEVPPPPERRSPELNNELNNVIKQIKGWDEWVSYRREIKKKMTPATIKKQVKFLSGRTPEEQQAIIDQSITNGWTGLFEVKHENNGRDNGDARRQRLSAAERVKVAAEERERERQRRGV